MGLEAMVFSYGIWKSEIKKGINYLINGCPCLFELTCPFMKGYDKV
jgi:hypothetical protein